MGCNVAQWAKPGVNLQLSVWWEKSSDSQSCHLNATCAWPIPQNKLIIVTKKHKSHKPREGLHWEILKAFLKKNKTKQKPRAVHTHDVCELEDTAASSKLTRQTGLWCVQWLRKGAQWEAPARPTQARLCVFAGNKDKLVLCKQCFTLFKNLQQHGWHRSAEELNL